MSSELPPPKNSQESSENDPSLGGEHPFNLKLLEILVCPISHGPLTYDPARRELISKNAQVAYPVRDGIPIFLLDEARQLEGE